MAHLNSKEVKEELAKEFKWIKSFEESVDQLVYQTVDSERDSGNNPIFNAYLVEDNFSALTDLLRKSLNYRDRINQLEEKAVRHAFEYKLATKNHELLRDIELAEWNESVLDQNAKGASSTKDAFASTNSILKRGFVAQYQAEIDQVGTSSAADHARRNLVRDKWKNVAQTREDTKLFHNQPGHPFNYAEQSGRLKARLKEELISMYWRARAVSAGLKLVFPTISKSDLPDLNDPREDVESSYLDDLTLWARRVARELTVLKQKELIFEHTISLNRNMHRNEPLVQGLSTKLKNEASLEFRLDKYFPPELGKLRLIGLQATLVWNHRKPENRNHLLKNHQMRALVFPPSQVDPYNPDSNVIPRPAVINNIIDDMQDLKIPYITGPTIQNIDPAAKNRWRIQLPSYYMQGIGGQRPTKKFSVGDVRLHLKLASEVSKESMVWDHDFWTPTT